MSVIDYENLFEVRKQKEEEKGQVTIVITPDLSIPSPDLMIRHRIKFDDILHSKITFNTISNCKDIKGSVTTFYKLDNKFKSIIFIQSEIIPYSTDLDVRYMNEAYKYTFLIHGLALVNDFENSINFNKHDKQIDVIKIETYAAVYVLKYFTVKSYDIARALYARRLLKLNNSSDGCCLQIQREIMKKYPKKKLLQWSKQL
ncbi:hypothetical protein MT391_18650 [Vibrio sp. 1-Bac 57]